MSSTGSFFVRRGLRHATSPGVSMPVIMSQQIAWAAESLIPPPQPPTTDIWLVRDNTMVFCSVLCTDVRDLDRKWAKYNLHARIGPPSHVQWGVLDYFDDFRGH